MWRLELESVTSEYSPSLRVPVSKKNASSHHWSTSYLSVCRVVYLLVQAYHSSYQIIFIILLIIQGWRRTRAQTKTFPTWRTLSFSWQTSYESAGKLCTFFQPDQSLQKSLPLNLISFSFFQTKHWKKIFSFLCVCHSIPKNTSNKNFRLIFFL